MERMMSFALERYTQGTLECDLKKNGGRMGPPPKGKKAIRKVLKR